MRTALGALGGRMEKLDGTLFGEDQPCFGCGPRHPTGFHLAFERDGEDTVTRFTPGERHQGAPGLMHGGLLATLADEVAAWAIIAEHGKFGFTTTFEARYLRAVRIGEEVEGRARCTSAPRRIVSVDVRLLQRGQPVFTGAFKFALLDRHAAEKLLEAPLPEEWLRFTR